MTKLNKHDKLRLKELEDTCSTETIKKVRGFLMEGYSFHNALNKAKE